MNRRDFLRATGGAATALSAGPVLSRAALAAGGHDFNNRVLVLVELNGGNDGINTVIPYADRAYQTSRPQLAIPRDQVLTLDERLGFHPALGPLMDAWSAGDLAVALGVGYPQPDRSHFRSIEIWNTGSASDQVLSRGWASGVYGETNITHDQIADALILSGDSGPFFGPGISAIRLDNPDRFVDRADRMEAGGMAAGGSALDHILNTRATVVAAASEIEQRLRAAGELGVAFPTGGPAGPFGRSLEVAARVIASGIDIPAIKLTLGSFDTHAGQANQHRNLLTQLGAGFAAFRQAMIGTDNWDRVLVMSYAEFGRRVGQNGSGGTDHGTAAPHFVMGGGVNGGFFGEQPSLVDLDAGDLKYTMDYRSLLASATQTWWGLPEASQTLGAHRPVPGLLS